MANINEETQRFTVSLPKQLNDILDVKLQRHAYSSRSEYIRDLIREDMIRDEWKEGESELVGVLTLIYDHHQTGLVEKMVSIQHDHHVHVLCTTHVHIDHFNCLETIIIRGVGTRIEQLCNAISGLKGVRFAQLTRTATVPA